MAQRNQTNGLGFSLAKELMKLWSSSGIMVQMSMLSITVVCGLVLFNRMGLIVSHNTKKI